MAEQTVPMLAPDGKTVGDVPVANQAEALAKGFKLVEAKPVDNYRPAPPLGVISPEIQGLTHEGRTPLVHVETGKLGDVPMENAPAAIQTGKFRLPTPEELQSAQDEADVAKRAQELEASGEYTGGLPGGAGAVLAGLAKGALGYGVAKAIADRDAKGSHTVQIERAAEERALENHPVAELAGRIPSELASAYSLGAAGDVASAGLGLQGIKAQALQGAFYGLEPAAASVVREQDNPKLAAAAAAEDLALGAIGNVVLHGAFEYAGKGINSVLEKADNKILKPIPPEEVETKQREAVNTISKALGVPPASMEKASKVIPQLIESKILERTDTLESAIKKVQDLEQSGPKIGKAIEELDGSNGKELVITDALSKAHNEISALAGQDFLDRQKLISQLEPAKAEDRAAKAAFEKVDTEFGNEIKNASPEQLQDPEFLKNLDNQYQVIKQHRDLTDAVVRGIQGQLREPLSPSVKQASKALAPILDEINNTAKKATFKDTQALKKFVGEQTNWSKDNVFANDLRKKAYGILREKLIQAEDQAASQLQNPEVAKLLQQNRAQYAWHRMMESFVDKTANKEVMHTTLEQLSHIPVGRHGLAGFIGHTLLGPLGSIGGVATSLGLSALKKYTKAHAVGVAVGAYQDAAGLVARASQQQDSKILRAAKETMAFLRASKKEGLPAISAGTMRQGINNWIPGNGSGKTHSQQLAALQKAVSVAQSNPSLVSEHLANVTQPLQAEGLHDVASAYTEHQLRLMKVLQVILPKDPSLAQAHPFSQNVAADDISPAVKAQYERALAIASKPENLLGMVKTNTITPMDVAIAAATNPMTLEKIRGAMIDEALKSKPDIGYQHRLSLGVLMGTNLEQSTQQLPVLQSVYMPQAPITPGTPNDKGGKKGSMSAKSSENISESVLTNSEKSLQNI